MNFDRLTSKLLQELDRVLIHFLERFRVVFREHLRPQGRDFSFFLRRIDQERNKLREHFQRAHILRFRAYLFGRYTISFLTGLVDLYTLTLVNVETVLDTFLGELDPNTSQQAINKASDQALHDLSQVRNLLFFNIDNLVDAVRKIARNTSE